MNARTINIAPNWKSQIAYQHSKNYDKDVITVTGSITLGTQVVLDKALIDRLGSEAAILTYVRKNVEEALRQEFSRNVLS